MSDGVLLTISILMAFIGGFVKKVYVKKFNGSKERNFCNTLVCLAVIIVFLIWGGFGESSLFTLLLGLAFGIVTGTQYLFSFMAISVGPWAYTAIISSLSTLIPTTSGWIFWGEPVSIFQVFGIIFLVGCLLLSTDTSSAENKKISFKWLFYAIITFITTGLIGVLQKIHQTSPYKGEGNAFLIIAFIISMLFSFVFFATDIFKEKNVSVAKKLNSNEYAEKKVGLNSYFSVIWILLIAFIGISAAVNNKLNLYLSGVFPTAFFFPITSGTSLLLTTLFAVVVFKEKLKKKQWLGFAFGVISFVFFCLSKIF